MKPGAVGFKRIMDATVYSMQGLKSAWKYEAAFRQESILLLVLTPVAFWLGRSLQEQLLLLGVCWLVLIVELLNSAIEAVVDRVGSERHELSGRAKDMGSAAIFMSLTLVVIVWLAVIVDRFIF